MTFWIIIAGLTLLVLLFILVPVLRAEADDVTRGDYDMNVYRRQIDEVEADRQRGVLTDAEASAARTEVERRMLQAGREKAAASVSGGRGLRFVMAAVTACAVPLLAVGLYGELGRPDLPGQALAERTDVPTRVRTASSNGAAPQQQPAGRQGGGEQMPSIDQMVGGLEKRLEEEPDNFQGWVLLARSYQSMQRYDEAVAAYQTAAKLPEAEDDPDIYVAMGEALISAAQGTVTERAEAAFRMALRIDPGNLAGQYYHALARYQAGDGEAAYTGWLAMAKVATPAAPWLPNVLERLRAVADDLDRELPDDLPVPGPGAGPSGPVVAQQSQPQQDADAPGPTAEDVRAAADMSAGDRSEMIRGMVARLADRLKDEPEDFQGWMRLGRAYSVLRDDQGALNAFANAARLKPDDVGARINHGGALVSVEPNGRVTDKAKAEFQAVLRLSPDNGDALWFMGVAARQAGDSSEARRYWGRLLSGLQPGSQEHRQVEAQIRNLGN